MEGLTLKQEAALAYLYMHQEDMPGDFSTYRYARAILDIRSQGFLEAQADMSYSLVFVQHLTALGSSHYSRTRSARRAFVPMDDNADLLMLELAAEDAGLKKAHEDPRFVTVDEDRIDDYWTLKRNGLIDGLCADDTLMYTIVTDNGRSYAEGWFLDQMDSSSVQINVSPTFNNDGSVRANSSSNSDATASIHDVTLGTTIGSIIDLEIRDADKQEAQEVVKELDAAAKSKNEASFAEKLEKIASIAKSSAALAPILLPYVKTAIGTLFG